RPKNRGLSLMLMKKGAGGNYMEFSQIEVKRAIRDFEKAIDSLQTAGFKVYSTRVRELINLITQNKVLSSIVGSYLVMEVDFRSIENAPHGDWFDLKLPEDRDLQIAYVLQIMKRSSEGEFSIENYSFQIFALKGLNDNIYEWNHQILFPCLDVLRDKLNDLVEDEVEGKEQVDSASLQIINYGNISAKNGNVAFGKDISQSITIGQLSDEVIKKALEQGFIKNEQI